jgi:hypothetical protein
LLTVDSFERVMEATADKVVALGLPLKMLEATRQ